MPQIKKLRSCFSHETTQWIQFLDQCFSYEAPQSYGIDFAPLFSEEAIKHSRLLWQGDEILASATLYPRELIIDGHHFKIGIIGAVATAPEYRGRGYSSELLKELESVARSLSLEGLILWSDQQEFYARLGYTPQGQQQLLPLSTLPKPATNAKGRWEKNWTLEEVTKLYDKHSLRLERNQNYWNDLEKITSCQRYQWVLNGEIKAYAALNKGRDLHNIVHEWGGEPLYLYHLVWALLQTRQDLQWLTHPDLHDPIRDCAVKRGGALVHRGHLALFKPLPSKQKEDILLHKIWFWGLDSL